MTTDFVLLYQVECWVVDFRDFMLSDKITKKEREFPVPQEKFIPYLQRFVKEDKDGIKAYEDSEIGLFDDKLKFMSISAISIGKPTDPYSTLYPIYQIWEQYIKDFVAEAKAKGNTEGI